MAEPLGYVALIRQNANFRRLWLGNVVSLFGDWFNTIALYSLILSLTGSEFALGAVFIAKMIPWALASPIAGLLVDRFDRRHVMIVSDLLRAVIVLALLLVDEPGEVYLVYVITAAQVVVGSVFQPAQSSSVPNIVGAENLVTANTILSATWSLLLTLGAALGGLAAEYLGLQAVFILDSASYLLSAVFIFRTVIPQHTEEHPRGSLVRTAVREIAAGWERMRMKPEVGRMALAKASWGLAGGGLVYMLTLVGESISPLRQSLAIGLLFAARGLGTGIGPVLARAWFKDETSWPTVMGWCLVFSGIGYGIVGGMPWSWWVMIPVAAAHVASGANWVMSTVLLQKRTEDRFRGRVFATEWLLFFAMDATSILVASLVLELGLFTLMQVILGFAVVQVFVGILWLVTVIPAEKREVQEKLPT